MCIQLKIVPNKCIMIFVVMYGIYNADVATLTHSDSDTAFLIISAD